jgi:ribosome-binding protein aMBF1 (putative translation factor)
MKKQTTTSKVEKTSNVHKLDTSEKILFDHKHLYTCLGTVVSARRKRLHMSQRQLAERSGIDRVYLSNLENGRGKPSFGTVSNIAHGLKIKYARLVGQCEDCARKAS